MKDDNQDIIIDENPMDDLSYSEYYKIVRGIDKNEKMRLKYDGDPIFIRDNKWYFYIETWADVEGPFDTEQECEEKLEEYSNSL